MILKGLIDMLKNDSPVTGAVGSYKSAAKVFPVLAPQEVQKPYICLRRSSAEGLVAKSNAYNKDETQVNVIVYIDERDGGYQKAIEILNLCRNVLDDKGDPSGQVVTNGVKILKITYNNSVDGFDPQDNSFIVYDSYAVRSVRAHV